MFMMYGTVSKRIRISHRFLDLLVILLQICFLLWHYGCIYSIFLFPLSFPPSLLLPLLLCHACKTQAEPSRPVAPRLDLERWYQDIMSAGDLNHACPPPLPVKSFSTRRPTQVNFSLLLLLSLPSFFMPFLTCLLLPVTALKSCLPITFPLQTGVVT